VFVFGRNDKGQLGLPTNLKPSRPSSLPLDAFRGQKVKMIASGTNHSLACTENGQVFAFGSNKDGLLGTGSGEDSSVPVPVQDLPNNIVFVACGERSSAAITQDGKLFTWGSNKDFQGGPGSLGYPSSKQATPNQVVKGLEGIIVKQITLGSMHAVCLTTDGEAYSWGRGAWGRLGRGDSSDSETPAKLDFNQKIVKLASTKTTSGLVAEDGCVYMWGKNETFLLGADSTGTLFGGGNFDGTSAPTRMGLPTDDKFVDISIGENLAAAVTESGEVWTWGKNIQPPRKIKGIQDVVEIDVGRSHMAFRTKDGQVYTMGDNTYNQLGTSSGTFNTSDPHLINGEFLPGHPQHVACGYAHTFVISNIE